MKTNTSLSKKMLQIASKDKNHVDFVLKAAEMITIAFNEDPFASQFDVRKRVCEELVKELKLRPDQAMQFYSSAKDVVIPFMSSGEKIAQADAQLDYIGKQAKNNLMQTKFNSQGEALEEAFNPAVANVVIQAIKTKTDMLIKTQKNVIEAQKTASEQQVDKELNLGQADRTQLENFLKQKLLNNPELAQQIIKKREEAGKAAKGEQFYRDT